MAKASFGAGCFWGVESAFRQVKGVLDAPVGYMGGTMPNPTYKDVCTDTTGHAEVLQVEYDPSQVSYEELLHVFFELHKWESGPMGELFMRSFYLAPALAASRNKTMRILIPSRGARLVSQEGNAHLRPHRLLDSAAFD